MIKKSSNLKTKVKSLIRKRQGVESELIRNTPMVAASFCIRPNGMYYLSASIEGESRHRYIKQEEREYWQKRCIQWRCFSESIALWVKLSRELEQLLRELGRSRLESLPKKKAKPGEI